VRHFIDAPHHHSVLGIHCLKLMKMRLMKNICGFPRYAMNNEVEDLPARRELCIAAPLSYACSSWANHIQLSSQAGGNTSSVLTLVNDFFTRHLLSWLEVLSIEEHLHTAIYSLHDVRSWLIENPNQDLSDLIDDCERFVLRSFDGIKQSTMHIYHSALSWTPTSSPTRQLYERELMTETKLVNAVGPTWDACIRIIPATVGDSVEAIVFSPSGALIAAYGKWCVKVFDVMTGVNRATFDGDKFICSVAFSPDDGFLVSGLGILGGTINVWNVQTGTMFRTFKWSMGRSTYSVAFSSCGTMIASGGSDGTVRIWNTLSGDCDCVLKGHSGAVKNICWLATWNQVVSASDDTVRIWDVRKRTCSKIFAQYHDPVAALASSRGLLLVASKNGTVNIYDSQSGDIIHVIRSNDIIHSCFSTDGGKVLIASGSSGDIWDITTSTLTRVQSISHNGEQATFSPDGTRVASIYGKFMKIWKTNAGYNHHESSTHVPDTIDDVYISPDRQLVTLTSKMGVDILDATITRSLFMHPVTNVQSIVFSLDSELVAFLEPPRTVSPGTVYGIHRPRPLSRDSPNYIRRLGSPESRAYVTGRESTVTVHIWNTHTHLHQSIAIDDDVFRVALSPDGSQLASLSSYHMKLWDLKSNKCLAHLEFDETLRLQAQISFSINATNVFVLETSYGTRSWSISPNYNIDLARGSIKNSDGTSSWLFFFSYFRGINDRIEDKLPMIFVSTTVKRSNQDTSVPCQSYRRDTDGEWILDQDGRRVLWIPPDERPRKIWVSKREKKVLVQTESRKVYYVKFSQS